MGGKGARARHCFALERKNTMKLLICTAVFLWVLAGPAKLGAQVSCGSSAQPCTINGTVSASGIALNTPNQSYVVVPVGTTITWSFSGVGSFFLVVLSYNANGSIFGPAAKIFFKGDSNTPVSVPVTSASDPVAVKYTIYALDTAGNPHVLDPKVRTTSGLHKPTKASKAK